MVVDLDDPLKDETRLIFKEMYNGNIKLLIPIHLSNRIMTIKTLL